MRFSLIVVLNISLHSLVYAAPEKSTQKAQQEQALEQKIEQLKKPLYSPFTERYLLDEVKNLRQMLADTRLEMTKLVVDRELEVADKAMMYATNTVTYFFYLLAGASTLLVLVGWNSLRDVKKRVGSFANEEILRITNSYEARLDSLEKELHNKSINITMAQEEIELTNETHSLWLKAAQEASHQGKINIYDQILALRPNDVEALTYKADSALCLGQEQWASSLANRALEIAPDNSHALYQRACAYAEMGLEQDALKDLARAIEQSESLRKHAYLDESFASLKELPDFIELVGSLEESEDSNK